jgi:hypothetical protein
LEVCADRVRKRLQALLLGQEAVALGLEGARLLVYGAEGLTERLEDLEGAVCVGNKTAQMSLRQS